jgi:YgiT-type zinc finger domain-containing protein
VKETFREEKVTYTAEVDGQLIIIRNVPARVSVETGEKLFSLETVERLQALIRGSTPPKQYINSPVFEFA